jgi:hypothetical protein
LYFLASPIPMDRDVVPLAKRDALDLATREWGN